MYAFMYIKKKVHTVAYKEEGHLGHGLQCDIRFDKNWKDFKQVSIHNNFGLKFW